MVGINNKHWIWQKQQAQPGDRVAVSHVENSPDVTAVRYVKRLACVLEMALVLIGKTTRVKLFIRINIIIITH